MEKDARTRQLTRHLRAYDRELYAVRINGMIQIFRNSTRAERFEFEGKKYLFLRPNPILILSLTDTWMPTGKIVDWGIEPLMNRIREMDYWRDDTQYDRFVRDRERKQESKQRETKNNVRAIAADLRSDFAKATNDINVSGLKKIDRRRLKYGNRQP